MFSAVDSADRFRRIKAAQTRAKGGEYSAFSLAEELAAEGLDIVERAPPPIVPPRSVPLDDAPAQADATP